LLARSLVVGLTARSLARSLVVVVVAAVAAAAAVANCPP
jgi:hypothetical protein